MKKDCVQIDGSVGEGGGQILRSALSLSIITGRPFHIENIRSGRQKPGLMRQHLTAVQAATSISSASVSGAEIGSTQLHFESGEVLGGDYAFSVGSAGSAVLVCQTVLLPLLRATKESRVLFEGGTHNPYSPPFNFLEKAFIPLLRKMGAKIDLKLIRPGFYPSGGGAFEVQVTPCTELKALILLERGEIKRRWAEASPFARHCVPVLWLVPRSTVAKRRA